MSNLCYNKENKGGMAVRLYWFFDRECSVHHSIDPQPKDSDFPLHAHRACEVFYCISGSGSYTVEGRNYPLVPGCVILMRDGETHKLHPDAGVPYERIAIQFPLDEVIPKESRAASLRALFLDHAPGQKNYYLPEDNRFIASCFSRICAPTEEEETKRVQFLSYLYPILSELSRVGSAVQEPEHRRPTETATVAEMIDYINRHLTELSGISELEERFFYSKSTINRLFRRSTGSTVWEFIIIKRLLLARQWIRAGKPAAVAAAACGFGDYSAFYRQYRRAFGESPCRERKSEKSAE